MMLLIVRVLHIYLKVRGGIPGGFGRNARGTGVTSRPAVHIGAENRQLLLP